MRYLVENPDQIFIFKDQKAGMTYHEEYIFYVVGMFDYERGEKYNTHVIMMAAEASMN